MSRKKRLDQLLVETGVARSREDAKRLVLAGVVRVDGDRNVKPGQQVSESAEIICDQPASRYVSRGGEKLECALETFGINPNGLVCGDFGASTGGFTHCLLERGALKVYAFDVGYGQLAWSLRNDPRVTLKERCNARYLTPDDVPEQLDLIVIDVSFISIAKVLSAAVSLLKPDGTVVCLVKPQFEVGKGKVGKGGVVRDPADWKDVIVQHRDHAIEAGLAVSNLEVSPLLGPAGNVEFLSELRRNVSEMNDFGEDIERIVANGIDLRDSR